MGGEIGDHEGQEGAQPEGGSVYGGGEPDELEGLQTTGHEDGGDRE